MKIHIVSDLHIETQKKNLPCTDADLSIFAGDIGPGIKGVNFVGEHAFFTKKPVIYVAGNHEFYRYEMNEIRKNISAWSSDDLNFNQFHFLDNSSCVIEGVRIIGCTLWTNFELFGKDRRDECLQVAEKSLNDFLYIFKDGKKFTPALSLQLHQESIEWLEAKLNEPFNGKNCSSDTPCTIV